MNSVNYRMDTSSAECTHLSDRREPYKADRCYTCPGDIEANASTSTSATLGTKELAAKLRELGLELTQVVARGLILLGCVPALVAGREVE